MIYNFILIVVGSIFFIIGMWGNFITITSHSFTMPFAGMPNPMAVAILGFSIMFILAGILHIKEERKIIHEQPNLREDKQ